MPERVFLRQEGDDGSGQPAYAGYLDGFTHPYVPEAKLLAAEAERDALRERLREAAEVLLGVVAIADALNARPDDGVGLHTRARAILDKMGLPGETP